MEQRLVLFDFDGTITTKDTLLEFIKFHCGTAKFLMGFALLSPVLIAMKLKLISNQEGKERVLQYFFSGITLDAFNATCVEFARKVIPGLIRPAALALLNEERSKKSVIAVVSASPENWVKPWCDTMNIACHSTRLQLIDGKVSGRIQGLNCYGPEKARRIKEAYNLGSFQRIISYGDTRGDREMLALAHESHYGPITK